MNRQETFTNITYYNNDKLKERELKITMERGADRRVVSGFMRWFECSEKGNKERNRHLEQSREIP